MPTSGNKAIQGLYKMLAGLLLADHQQILNIRVYILSLPKIKPTLNISEV